jgi:SAM-dependent methyltransferase
MVNKILNLPLAYRVWSSIHFKIRADQIREAIKEDSHLKILDLGCGIGLLKKYLPPCEYFGIDINPKYIEYAKRHANGCFYIGDIMQLNSYINNIDFDYLILNGVLHHLNNPQIRSLFKNIVNYIDKDGKIIIIDLVREAGLNYINKIFLRCDRGNFIRDKAEYSDLIRDYFHIASNNNFSIRYLGVNLWKLVKFILEKKPS